MASLETGARLTSLSRFAVALALSLVALHGAAQPAPSDAARPSDEAPGGAAGVEDVTLPELEHFEEAPYPAEALEQLIEGEVGLVLTVGTDGRVTNVDVVAPAGHGFDEAAAAAARLFVFRPATRGGTAVSVKIPYTYSFRLPQEPTGAASIAPEMSTPAAGGIEGKVEIRGGAGPLVGARVIAVSPEGVRTTTTTDASGRYAFRDLPPGSYRLRFDAPGFEPFGRSAAVIAGQTATASGQLAPAVEGIEITVAGERPPRDLTKRTVERREIERIPGTSGDALRSIQSQPGVARPPGLLGLLIVRGSAPEDTEVFVDSTNVPLVYHFGGLSSVVPTELLDRIDFYPGNFGVRYGQLMGGVVDVGLATPDTQCFEDYGKPTERKGCYHGLAEVDLIDTRLIVQGPVGASKNWRFAVAGRRSWVDAWLKPVLEQAGSSVTSAPVYYDYQLIVDHEPARGAKLSMRFYGSSDRLELIINDPAAQDPAFGGNLDLSTQFYRGQVLYRDQLSRNVKLEAMLSAGRNAIEFKLGTFLFDLAVHPISFRSEFAVRLGRGATLNAGTDLVVAPFDLVARLPPPPRPGEPDPGPFAAQPPVESRRSSTAFRPGWYADVELEPSKRLRIVPGFRFDFARDSGHQDFSPRITARYDVITNRHPDTFERTTLKGGVGFFHQPPQFQETDEVFGTPGLLSNRSIHYSLGVERELSRQIELSVEGFYKDFTRLVSRDESPAGGFEYNNDGTGKALGLETLLKYKPDERFFGWIAYTLSRSVRTDGPDEEERLFDFDQTHNLIILGSYRIGRGWEVGSRFRVVSGPLTTPVVAPPALPALYAADAASYVGLRGKPFSRRLPLFHQLDIRIDKRWQFKSWRLSAFLDVQNVYNNQAVEALVYNYNFSQERFQTGLPIIPSLGVRGEF